MRIAELYRQPKTFLAGRTLTVSLELFPPKSDDAEEALFHETLPQLLTLRPGFISVTYGAGGGTRERTLRIAYRIRQQFGVESMAHLTCTGQSRQTIAQVLDQAQALGLENILALRGDPPRGQTEFIPEPDGFAHATDLIRFIRSRYSFSIGAAFYPEGHQEAPDKYRDWDFAAEKVAAGAEFLISQLFYNSQDFIECVEYLRHKRRVNVPLIPGVLPFLSKDQVRRFTRLCGAKLPDNVNRRLDEFSDDESVRQYGVEVCTQLCLELLDYGVPGLHIYCLNRVESSRDLLANLGLRCSRDCS
ncbi:MAG: methylenetetrahydrofolate reductase [Gemmatales bacterium]|nr:methylenetetrahydrofolate reductase [Gemmatales bacterium]MDW8222130.1 methylenetetrahydrofolate reductase [Gemmatales bacterium]